VYKRQAKGEPLDARTDLFSLGSVLYEMATAQPAFGGRSTAEVFAALLMKDPPPVSSLNPAMPRALDPIVAKLLAKDREQRYGSAEELLAGLEAIAGSPSSGAIRPAAASSIPPASAPLPPPETGWRRARNRMIVLGVLLLVAFAGGAFLLRNRLGIKPGPATKMCIRDRVGSPAFTVSTVSATGAGYRCWI